MGLLAARHRHCPFSARGNSGLPGDSLLQGSKGSRGSPDGEDVLGHAFQFTRQCTSRTPVAPRRVLLQFPHAQIPVGCPTCVVVYVVLEFREHPSRANNVLDIHIHLSFQDRSHRTLSWGLPSYWQFAWGDNSRQAFGLFFVHHGQTKRWDPEARTSTISYFSCSAGNAGWNSYFWSLCRTARALYHTSCWTGH